MHSTTSRRILTRSIASLLVLTSVSFADTTWTGAIDANFNNAGNWDNGAPAGQNARINTIAGNIATISADAGQMNEIFVARGGSPGLLNHSAGTASTAGWMDVGTDGGTGTYNLANFAGTGGTLTGLGLGSGSMTVGGLLFVGGTGYNNAGGTGTVNINTSGTLTLASDLQVGKSGTGVINMDAGTLNRTAGWNVIGRDAGGNGAFNMSGGTVTGPNETVIGLDAGTGALNMSGGTYTSGGQMQIGRGGANGAVTVSGASAILNVNSELRIGQDGSGTSSVTVSAGTVNVNSWLVASAGNTQGTLTISGTGVLNQGLTDGGSRLEITNPGGTGTGTVNLDGGTLNTNGIIASGDAAATSIFNFNGGTLKPRADNGGFMGGLDRANVRNGGAKIDTNGFNITIGQALVHSDIGGDAATDGGLTKNGAGTLTLTAENTFNGGVTINQGTVATLGGGQTGRLGQGPATVNAGAFLQSNGGDSFGFLAGGASVINVVGGTITTSAGAFRTTLPNLNMTGGTLTSAGNTGDASGVFSFNEGTTVTTNAAATTALFNAPQIGMQGVVVYTVADGSVVGSDLAISSNLTDVTYGGNAGGLTKAGPGVLALSGVNTYTGPTNVNAGTLLVSGSLSGSLVNVNNGGTLGGSGTITTNNQAFTLAAGGKLSPGSSAGNLTVDTGTAQLNISAAGAGALVFELDSLSLTSDKITLAGTSTLNIGLAVLEFDDFAFSNLGGLEIGTYTLFDSNSTIIGTLGANLSGSIGGFTGTIGLADSGRDLVLMVVPEPGSMVSLLGGLTCLLGLQRMRRRRESI